MENRADPGSRAGLTRAATPLLLALAVLVVHWPPAGADFVYDDRDMVEMNQAIRSLGGGLAGFLLPFPPEQPERALYRPLTQLSFAVDYALFGLNARGFHATNVLLYVLGCLAMLRLATALLGATGSALAWQSSGPFTRSTAKRIGIRLGSGSMDSGSSLISQEVLVIPQALMLKPK